MSERTPDGSAFGFSDVTLPEPEKDPLSDEYVEQPEQAPEQPTDLEDVQLGQDFDEQDEEYEAPEAPAAEEAPPPVEEPRLYAGRYGTTEALEKGYSELQAEYTRDHQARLALEQRQQQVEAILQGLVPMLEQQLAQQDPEALEQYRAQQAIAEQARIVAEQQVAPIREEMEFQRQQSQVEQLVSQFRARHPDAGPGTQMDRAVVGATQELGLNAANLDSLEVAYEAVKDPWFKQVVKANPVLVESNEGIAYARIQARLLEGLAGTGQPAPQRQASQGQPAYVETGEGGAPAKAASTQYDEFDEALDAYNKERRSPLFGTT